MQEACLPLCINVKLRCRDQPNPQPTTLQFIYPCPASYNLFDLGYFLELKIIELFDHFEHHHPPIFLSSLQRDGHDILWHVPRHHSTGSCGQIRSDAYALTGCPACR